jgi:phospholipid/cholesterol/gamma-HCH transport system substrate-binding protein
MAQSNRPLEIGTGLFVVLGFAALAYLTTQLPGSGLQLHGRQQGYTVTAQFDDIGGLKVGAPVTMAGVRIGQVDAINIDPSDYRAKVTLVIERRFSRIPDDSNAAIQTSGLLGANYVGITAGSSDSFLHAGSDIPFTQSALVLENLINKFFANTASGGSSSNSSGGNGPGGGSAAPDTPKAPAPKPRAH